MARPVKPTLPSPRPAKNPVDNSVKPARGRARTWDRAAALQLRLQRGWSYPEIARHLGIATSTLQDGLGAFKALLDQIQDGVSLDTYTRTRRELLTAVEMQLLMDLTDAEKRKKATLGNVAYALQHVHNIRRLESGQSTENISIIMQGVVASHGPELAKYAEEMVVKRRQSESVSAQDSDESEVEAEESVSLEVGN